MPPSAVCGHGARKSPTIGRQGCAHASFARHLRPPLHWSWRSQVAGEAGVGAALAAYCRAFPVSPLEQDPRGSLPNALHGAMTSGREGAAMKLAFSTNAFTGGDYTV